MADGRLGRFIILMCFVPLCLMGQEKRQYTYGYVDRDHSTKENLGHLGAMYLVSWIVFPLSQSRNFKDYGGWKQYRKNFGDVVFDNDEPIWNWLGHTFSGSQFYLYYRANGYDPHGALVMTSISSALFEFTVETYTTPASVQDLYQTPVLGSLVGYGIEKLSMFLLNSGSAWMKVVGHIINPATMFWFYEGRVRLEPRYTQTEKGLFLSMDF